MSLDVYLITETKRTIPDSVPVRRGGKTERITIEEYNTLYPDREPIVMKGHETNCVFTYNVTHNLGKMASKAGLYDACWRPDEHGYTHANMLIEPLKTGLKQLKSDPKYFKTYNPDNGWGTYEGLIEFVEAYLAACKKFPYATVEVSR